MPLPQFFPLHSASCCLHTSRRFFVFFGSQETIERWTKAYFPIRQHFSFYLPARTFASDGAQKSAQDEEKHFKAEIDRIQRELEQEALEKGQRAPFKRRPKYQEMLPGWWSAGFFTVGCASLLALLYYGQTEHDKKTLKPGQLYQVPPEKLGLPAQDDPFKDFGGDWTLINCETGEMESSEQFRGSYVLLYWGYTNCPDVCWEELDKITKVTAELQAEQLPIVPVFISIDPYRDNTENIKKYLSEISPLLKGFTGTPEQIREASRKFRIYYMVSGKNKVTGDIEEDPDYLVDHSMRSYLIGPDGRFIKPFLRLENAREVTRQIREIAGLESSKGGILKSIFGLS